MKILKISPYELLEKFSVDILAKYRVMLNNLGGRRVLEKNAERNPEAIYVKR